MLKTILCLALVSLLAFTGFTQMWSRAYSTCGYGEGNRGLDKCKEFQGDLAYSQFPARAAVDRIFKHVGLGAQSNIVLIPCTGIDGALAGVEQQGKRIIRIIWYDPAFMAKLNKSANSDSPSWTILAHEVAHHLQSHMLSASDLEQSRKDELAADRFSGFVLFKLGASLKQAQDTLKAFPDVHDENFSRHPKHERRVAEIAEGYYEAAAEQARKSTPAYSYVLSGVIQYYPCHSPKTLMTYNVSEITAEHALRKFQNIYGRFESVSVTATQITNGKPCGVPRTMGNSPHQHIHVPGLPDDSDVLSVGDQGTPRPYFKGGWQGHIAKNDASGCMYMDIFFEPSTACDDR